MKRGGYIQRHTELRPARWGIKPKPARRLSSITSDKPHLAHVASLPCCLAGLSDSGPCRGRITVSHVRHYTGGGLKPHDRRTLPMCEGHHEQWEQFKGFFAGWSGVERMAWANPRVVVVCLSSPVPYLAEIRCLQCLELHVDEEGVGCWHSVMHTCASCRLEWEPLAFPSVGVMPEEADRAFAARLKRAA